MVLKRFQCAAAVVPVLVCPPFISKSGKSWNVSAGDWDWAGLSVSGGTVGDVMNSPVSVSEYRP